MRLKVDFWWVWMPKWWFFQTSFEDQTINCKQLPKVQKHTKTICFLMILRVRCFGRWKKKLWKSNEKLELKLDMHVWWMFDRFWIDFPRISRSFLDANWFQRGYQRRSQRVMSVNVRRGGQKCCSGEKNAALGRPGDCRNLHRWKTESGAMGNNDLSAVVVLQR